MAKTELNVLFKKMQRDDKKEVLKFEIKGDSEQASNVLYELAGDIVNFEIVGCDTGPVTAEFAKINRDSKKTVLDFSLKGDREEKALMIYKYAGHNVTLIIEPSQMSLEDFHDEDNSEKEEPNDHEGVEYSVNLGGSVQVNESDTDHKDAAAAGDDNEDPFGDNLD